MRDGEGGKGQAVGGNTLLGSAVRRAIGRPAARGTAIAPATARRGSIATTPIPRPPTAPRQAVKDELDDAGRPASERRNVSRPRPRSSAAARAARPHRATAASRASDHCIDAACHRRRGPSVTRAGRARPRDRSAGGTRRDSHPDPLHDALASSARTPMSPTLVLRLAQQHAELGDGRREAEVSPTLRADPSATATEISLLVSPSGALYRSLTVISSSPRSRRSRPALDADT